MKSSIFYAARVLATVFCLAAVSFAAGGTEYCSFGKDRECVLRADSITYNNLPDSLKTTLQERFDKDSSFVFWGNVKSYDFIAYTTSSHTHYSEDISNEDRKQFDSWAIPHSKEILTRVDSVPADLKQAFLQFKDDIDYSFLKVYYHVDKVYDRATKTWKAPPDSESTIARKMLVRRGVYIETNPPKLFTNISQISFDVASQRIFFANGYSSLIDESQLDSLQGPAFRNGIFIPQNYVAEIGKNMSPVYKERIKNALVKGDKETIRNSIANLDSFMVKSIGKIFIGNVVGLGCTTRRLLNAYLGTFEDNMECTAPGVYNESTERTLYMMLQDSLRALQKSGDFEKSMAKLGSGDRAFWRTFIGASTLTDQNEINTLITANADSIKKLDQRDFIVNTYYKDVTFSNFVVGVAMGGGINVPLGKMRDTYPTGGSFGMQVYFFYKRFGFSFFMHNLASADLTDSTSINGIFMDIPIGFRTFSFPYVENYIFAGPTIAFNEIRNEKQDEVDDEETTCGFHISTAFDFYFTKPKIYTRESYEKLQMSKDVRKLRLGVRLQAGYIYNNSHMLKTDDGNFYAMLSLIIQERNVVRKSYGE